MIINKCIPRKLLGVPVLICQASIKHLSVSLEGLSDIQPTHPKLDHIGMIEHLGQCSDCLVEGLQNKSHPRRNIQETQVQVIVFDQIGLASPTDLIMSMTKY